MPPSRAPSRCRGPCLVASSAVYPCLPGSSAAVAQPATRPSARKLNARSTLSAFVAGMVTLRRMSADGMPSSPMRPEAKRPGGPLRPTLLRAQPCVFLLTRRRWGAWPRSSARRHGVIPGRGPRYPPPSVSAPAPPRRQKSPYVWQFPPRWPWLQPCDSGARMKQPRP